MGKHSQGRQLGAIVSPPHRTQRRKEWSTMGSMLDEEITDRDFEALRQSLLSRRRLLQYGAAGAGALAAGPLIHRSRAAAANQDEQPQPGGRLRAIYTNDPDVLDPHLTSSIAAIRVIDLVYETLLGFDENQQ